MSPQLRYINFLTIFRKKIKIFIIHSYAKVYGSHQMKFLFTLNYPKIYNLFMHKGLGIERKKIIFLEGLKR